MLTHHNVIHLALEQLSSHMENTEVIMEAYAICANPEGFIDHFVTLFKHINGKTWLFGDFHPKITEYS